MKKILTFLFLVVMLVPAAGQDFRKFPQDFRLVKITATGTDGSEGMTRTFQYTETGLLLRSVQKWQPDSVAQIFEYHYANEGDLYENIHIAAEASGDRKNGRTAYIFREGRLVELIEYNERELALKMLFYTFDTKKRLIAESLVLNWADSIQQTLSLYEYNTKGLLAARTVYYTGLWGSKQTYQFVQDGKGTLATITENDEQKKPASVVTFQYDKKDLLLKKTVLYRDYSACNSYTETLEYDKNANPVKMTILDYQGKAVTTYTLEWEKGENRVPGEILEDIFWNLPRVGC